MAVPAASGAAELPGAAKQIDASQYASLQAALDAVPAEGGYARIAITGNAFSDSFIGDGKTRREIQPTSREEDPNEATGILLETSAPIALFGNVFSGLTTPPVRSTVERQGDDKNNVVVPEEAAE